MTDLQRHTPPTIPVVSLFCGPGGMDLGFREQGFQPILAIDKEQSAVETYNHNDPNGVAIQGDLSRLSGEDVARLVRERAPGITPRGVIGGPPCQYFSSGNVLKKEGDPRRFLPLRYAEILRVLNREFNIDFFVFENVPGLKYKKHKAEYKAIQDEFNEAGFRVFDAVLNANWFGVAQNRKRLLIVGFNKELHPNIEFHFPAGGVLEQATVEDVIGGLPEPSYYTRDIRVEDIPHHPNHWTMNPRSIKFVDGSANGKGRSFKKLEWHEPSPTVAYGNREIHVHPRGHRRLSIFEAMRLQGFPENYEFKGSLSDQTSQVSDAVPPPMAEAIAEVIRTIVFEPIKSLQNKLIRWWEENQRDFPWRRTRDPYKILVAEKLLQQTAAKPAVVQAYKSIIKEYPNVESLAEASSEHVEQFVKPLGFTYRAHELPILARVIRDNHGCKVPNRLDALMDLPGVGDYSARAVLTFAFEYDVPVVDTNVARFLFRLYDISDPMPSNPARNRRLINVANSLIPSGNSRNFNLAILDLCASICTQVPNCKICPVINECRYGSKTAKENSANSFESGEV